MHRTNWLRGAAVAALAAAMLAGCSKSRGPLIEDLPGEWRQWRGPNAQGLSSETGLPERWGSDSANVRWKARVPGLANSSPIVSGGKVFLTTAWGRKRFHKFGQSEPIHRAVLAFDAETGLKLWEQVIFKTAQERRHYLNTPAAVTPTADGERLYVYFGMGLAALDYDGKLLWEKEVDPHYIERARYGVVSSPVVIGDAVIIARDDEWGGDEIDDISWLAAYDKRTGDELWRSENDETCCSYTTPVLREGPSGVAELIFASTPFIAAYDPASGERLWRIDHTLRQIVPTVLLSDDLLILPGSVHMRAIAVYRLSGGGAQTRIETLWGGGRSAPKIPSPVVTGGNLVILTDNGILAAYDPVTGDRRWQERLGGGNYRASLVAGDGKIYATSVDCEIVVVDPEGKTLAKNRLDGNCEASPAIAGGTLFVRTATELYAIQKAENTGAPGKAGKGRRRDGEKKGKKNRKARESRQVESPPASQDETDDGR